jgi:CRISPR-associated protein Csm4
MNKLNDQPFLELSDFLDLAEGKVSGLMKKELQNPIERMLFKLTAPRVTLDRLSAASNVFSTTGWRFKEGSGLYFLARVKEQSMRIKLELCMRMLGESGLGGERSVGYGCFAYDVTEVGSNDTWSDLFKAKAEEETVYCALSFVSPSEGEEGMALSYRLIERKGWIFSRSSNVQLKRRACSMFAEGSLFGMPVRGSIVDVTPSDFADHRVYRYGLGMMVEMKQADGHPAYR